MVKKCLSWAMEDTHRRTNFEIVSRYGKSMMPISVMDVNYACRSIANRKNLLET